MASRIKWILFGLLCVTIGLYPVAYLITDGKFGLLSSKSALLLTSKLWYAGFYIHIILGGVALLIGWIQFSEKFRHRNMQLHRNIGKAYVLCVLPSALAAAGIAFFATGGWIPTLGFSCLALVWFTTTLIAYTSIRKGYLTRHREMMIYSYAACFSAVTLRIWLPLLVICLGDFIPAYKIVAWLAWVPNLIVAYFMIHKQRKKIAFG